MRKKARRTYILAYTILFCMFAGIICAYFAIQGKSFIWGPQSDGMRQHYISLVYYGEFLRSLPRQIFVEHTFPMWDFQMGYGADILTTLHYYTIGDPLNLLSALVPPRYTEYLYDFLILLRMYLAGAAFSAYCLYRGRTHAATLLGALIYTFSGWILFCGFRHPLFINPCIYFPLLLLGVEKIFRGTPRKTASWLYVGMVAVSALSNFYFFYMMGILVVVYGIFRYFSLFGRRGLKSAPGWALRFALYSVTGILIAMPILLPVLSAVAETGRLNAGPYVPGSYSSYYYFNLIPALFGKFQSHHTIIGVSVICLPCLAILFLRKGKWALKAGFLFLLMLLCVPFAGHILNGFTYATNRFSWAMVLMLSYLFVLGYPYLFRLKPRLHLLAALSLLLYAAYVTFVPVLRDAWSLKTAVLAAAAALILLAARTPLRNNRSLQFVFAFVAATAGILVNVNYNFSPQSNPRSAIKDFVDSGTAYDLAYSSLSEEIAKLPDIADYRFEQMGTELQFNSSLLTRQNSGQYFFSLVNGNFNRYQEETGFNKPYEQRMQNQNGRAFLMKLASMRYFTGRQKYVPYGYEKLSDFEAPAPKQGETKNAVIWEDKNALSFAYTYDRYIPKDTYLSMSIAARQQAMLQGVVLEESSLPECIPEDLSENRPYLIAASDGLTLDRNKVEVHKRGASLTLSFNGLPRCETYVVFEGLNFSGPTSARGKTETILNLQLSGTAGKKTVERMLSFVSEKNNFYSGRRDFIGNLGYQKKAFSKVKITFPEKGLYSFNQMEICCQPMTRLNDYAAARRANIRSLPRFSTNQVQMDLHLDTSRAVVFSIPYSKGWKAWINGKPTELKQANTLYMAVEAAPGDTEILLRYQTPGLLPGLGLCVLGILLALGMRFIKPKQLT